MSKKKHIRNENKRKKNNKRKITRPKNKKQNKTANKGFQIPTSEIRSSWTLASHNPGTAFACHSGRRAQWKGGSPSQDPSAPYRPGTIVHRSISSVLPNRRLMRAFEAETLCAPRVIVMTAAVEHPVSGNLNANRSYHKSSSTKSAVGWLYTVHAGYRVVCRHVC